MTPLPDWGICTTVKAPVDQVLAFAAHHLALGPARIWLHFDDPDDPALPRAADLPRVTAVACGEAYWQALLGRRPGKHQLRQSRNVERVYTLGAVPWLLHIDIDEFLLPRRLVPEVLSEVPDDCPVLRLAPWEALHDPSLRPDIFTARHFRRALKGRAWDPLRRAVFGDYADLLPQGALSHAVGKCFFRRGVPGMQPRIHGAEVDGEKLNGGAFCPDIALLHFHAQDPAGWRARLDFRRMKGAYSFNLGLAGFLAAASDAERADFYDATQVAHPHVLALLREGGALIEADLGLSARVAALEAAS
ncbi:MAG TPA: glycosyltransferase family 2 protein [Paracoccaceae bacterium]|nr:glycosyltransferase family 2 protein [Paracoccaceae bacterium]